MANTITQKSCKNKAAKPVECCQYIDPKLLNINYEQLSETTNSDGTISYKFKLMFDDGVPVEGMTLEDMNNPSATVLEEWDDGVYVITVPHGND